jgi:polyisoprenoid-binding protein YceI
MLKFARGPIWVAALIALTPISTQVIATGAGELTGPLYVDDASVAVRCPLTIGSSFDAKTNTLSGELVVDPSKAGAIDGTLAVDLRTLQTGIGLRDTHMRESYLEVQKGDGFQIATLTRIHLDGVDPTLPVGKARFRGMLLVHGQEREVMGTADIKRAGQALKVQASFPVNVSDFAIASPTYLGVGMRNQVTVSVSFQILPKAKT